MKKTIVIVYDIYCPQVECIRNLIPNGFRLILHPFEREDDSAIKTSRACLLIVIKICSADDCLKLIERVRNSNNKLPILLCTQNPSQKELLNSVHAGATDVLEIPFEAQEFLSIMVRMCRRFHLGSNPPLTTADKVMNLFGVLEKVIHKSLHSEKVPRKKEDHVSEKEHILPKVQFSQCADLQTPNTVLNAEKNYTSKSEHCIHIKFFGEFQVLVNEELVSDWAGKKSRRLFAYLAYKRRPVVRDQLMEIFWHGYSPDSARNCLNVTLHTLRTTLERGKKLDILVFKDDHYLINPDYTLVSDVEQFRMLWRQGCAEESKQQLGEVLRHYEEALKLYCGDFLSEFPYESWCDLERENLKETYLMILNKLSHYYSLDGKPEEAIEMCTLILKEDPCREDAHRRLMRCFIRTGQKDRALRQFEKCRQILKKEFDCEPSRNTKILFDKIKGNP